MTAFSSNGFTLLLWINPRSPAVDGLDDQQQAPIIEELLGDAVCLLSCRWGIDFSFTTVAGTRYAYGICNKFTIGVPTLTRALGTLTEHVEFKRGSVNDTAEGLIRYKRCLEKWKVPDVVTDSGSGDSSQEHQSVPYWRKRK